MHWLLTQRVHAPVKVSLFFIGARHEIEMRREIAIFTSHRTCMRCIGSYRHKPRRCSYRVAHTPRARAIAQQASAWLHCAVNSAGGMRWMSCRHSQRCSPLAARQLKVDSGFSTLTSSAGPSHLKTTPAQATRLAVSVDKHLQRLRLRRGPSRKM